jgi:type IV secretory pathway VirB9-like protein
VKPPIVISVACGIVFGSSVIGFAAPEPRHLEPNAPRTVTVTESATPPVIRAGLLQSTLILLPVEEKIATVFGGDTVDWVFDGGHVASRFISIKPKVANSSTDIHIVSDHGNEYTLQLREISSDADPHFDSKILIAPGDKGAKEKLGDLPVFVPAAELDKVRQEAAAARTAEATERKAEEAKAEQYHKKAREVGLQQIWRDDKFTYLRGQFQETPALYELKDKKGSLINFDYSDGLYTVPKELENGYLAIGKQKVEFSRVAERK